MSKIDSDLYSIPSTGDCCVGDEILFTEAVFGGSFRRPKFLGEREVAGLIVADSYGGDRGQHTFTIQVRASEGHEPIEAGEKIRRKGRNIYRNGTSRRPWPNEAARKVALTEKHGRGDVARAARAARKEEFFR